MNGEPKETSATFFSLSLSLLLHCTRRLLNEVGRREGEDRGGRGIEVEIHEVNSDHEHNNIIILFSSLRCHWDISNKHNIYSIAT